MALPKGTSADYAGSLNEEIIAANAVVHLPKANVMLPLVTAIPTTNTDIATVPVWNTSTATITASDVAAQPIGDSETGLLVESELDSVKQQIILASYGVNVPVFDEAQFSSLEDLNSRIAVIGANAVGEKIDTLLTALFAALGGGTSVGTTTTNMKTLDLFDALGVLKGNSAPGPYNCVHHPAAIWGTDGLMADLGTSVATGSDTSVTNVQGGMDVSNQALNTGLATTVAGIGIYSSPTIALDTANRKGAVFSKEALGCAYNTPIIKVEAQRQATYLKTNLVFSMFGGVKELVDSYGVLVNSKTQ